MTDNVNNLLSWRVVPYVANLFYQILFYEFILYNNNCDVEFAAVE